MYTRGIREIEFEIEKLTAKIEKFRIMIEALEAEKVIVRARERGYCMALYGEAEKETIRARRG